MTDTFKDIIPSIMVTGKKIDDNKAYVPFLINKALSFHMDCVLYANEMNINHWLDKSLQYDYLLNTVRRRKRPFRWVKKSKSEEDIDVLREYYGYSEEKALQVVHLLTREQIDEIKTKIRTGGLQQ
jgi:hypothetical protein